MTLQEEIENAYCPTFWKARDMEGNDAVFYADLADCSSFPYPEERVSSITVINQVYRVKRDNCTYATLTPEDLELHPSAFRVKGMGKEYVSFFCVDDDTRPIAPIVIQYCGRETSTVHRVNIRQLETILAMLSESRVYTKNLDDNHDKRYASPTQQEFLC